MPFLVIPPLQALIANGSPMIALGHESGPIMISGSASGDGTKKPLSFHWNCLDSDTHEPCFFNFASLDDSDLEIASNRNYVLIDSTMQRQPELLLDSSNFMPNRELILSLQVHDRNDTNRVSNPELTLLKITSGDAPQVFMGSIYISRKYRANIRSPHNLAIMVPAHTPLLIKGTVKSSVPLSYLAWEANNFIHPLNWNTKRGSWRNGETHTELHIHSDHIYPYGLHVFKLKACNTNDQCSEATTQFTASQGVTQCSISIPAYHEYELVNVSVEKCNIPPGYGPLVYQLYAINEKTEEIFPITVPQFSNVFLFPGLPAIDQEKAENTFALKFCDTFNYCEMVYASPTTVYPNENKTSLIDDLLKLARKYNIGGDPFHAMQSLGIILKEASLDKPLQYKTMSETIDYNLEVLQRPSQLLNRGQLALSLGLLSEIVRKSDNNRLREKAMDAIRKLAEKGYSLEMIPDLMTIRSTMFNLMFPYSRGAGLIAKADDLPKTLKSSRKVFNVLLQMAAAQLSLGKRVEFGSYSEDLFEDEKQESIFKTIMIHDKTIEGTHLKIGDTEVTIKIGKSVKKRFAGSWKCTPDSLCNSVVYSYTVFPTSGPFPEVSDGYRIAPILMFNIFTPGTGKLQTIKTGLNAVEVTFTYTGNRSYGLDYSTKCKSWSDTKDSWKPDGVHLLRASHERISCWSGFIAPFTVYRIPQRWNVGAVASMVFGGLLFFILVGFTIIICSSKSPTAQRLSQPPFDRRMLRPMTE
uniref:PKD/REJ-like domain-containing protein n=1 Tax=Tetranychus urticae TaxID=32264 RepID=T1K5A1_TETUR